MLEVRAMDATIEQNHQLSSRSFRGTQKKEGSSLAPRMFWLACVIMSLRCSIVASSRTDNLQYQGISSLSAYIAKALIDIDPCLNFYRKKEA